MSLSSPKSIAPLGHFIRTRLSTIFVRKSAYSEIATVGRAQPGMDVSQLRAA
jgi:hypothetical protein